MTGEVRFQINEARQEEVFENMEFGGVVTYTTEYAHHVEFDSFWGTTPPPYGPIRRWVDRKWADLSTELKTDSKGNVLSADRVAWKVVNIIHENGIEGVFYGRRSLEYAKRHARGIAEQYEGSDDPRAPQKIIEDVLDLGFSRSQSIVAKEASDTGDLLQSGLVDTTEDLSELPGVS